MKTTLLYFSSECFQTVWSQLNIIDTECAIEDEEWDRSTSSILHNCRVVSESLLRKLHVLEFSQKDLILNKFTSWWFNSLTSKCTCQVRIKLHSLELKFRSNLWMVAVPAGRVFDDHALQIIPTVSHCTKTEDPTYQIEVVAIENKSHLQWKLSTHR